MESSLLLLNNSDFILFGELLTVFKEAFRMEDFKVPSRWHLEKILSTPGFISIVSIKDKKIMGGLTAYTLPQYYSEKPIAYLYDLAVKPEFQKQGIGTALFEGLVRYCKKRGYRELFVQAHRVDDLAVKLYRSLNPTREDDMLHFTFNTDE
jgi:aminoglycoside 3-N-acetyltransferase I